MGFPVNEVLIAAVFTGVALLITRAIDFFKAKSAAKIDEKKADSVVRTNEVEKAADMYREMIADLRKDIDQMLAYLRQLEQERLACREENATLKGKVATLEDKVNSLENELKKRPS